MFFNDETKSCTIREIWWISRFNIERWVAVDAHRSPERVLRNREDTASMRLDTMRRGRGSESLHRNNSGMRCHGKSRKTVEFQRFPLIFIDFLWFPLISNDFQWVPLIFCNFARQWCRVGGSEGRVGGGWWSNECPNMHAVFPMPQDPSIGPVDAYGDRTSRQIKNIAKSHG